MLYDRDVALDTGQEMAENQAPAAVGNGLPATRDGSSLPTLEADALTARLEQSAAREAALRAAVSEAAEGLLERDRSTAFLLRANAALSTERDRLAEELRACAAELAEQRREATRGGAETARLGAEVVRLDAEAAAANQRLATMRATRIWRTAMAWWRLRDRLLRRGN